MALPLEMVLLLPSTPGATVIPALCHMLVATGYTALRWTCVLDPQFGHVRLDAASVVPLVDDAITADVLYRDDIPNRTEDALTDLACLCSPVTGGAGVFVLDHAGVVISSADAIGQIGAYSTPLCTPQLHVRVVFTPPR